MDNSSAGGVRAVNRALDILMAFRDGDAQLGAAELAARVKLSRPTLYRLLYTLQEAGFVQAVGEPQRFRLGASVGQLARVWSSAGSLPLDIPSAAQPMMKKLLEDTGETVALFTPDGIDRLCVAEMPSAHALSFKRGPGYRERVVLGASGRVILAQLPHSPAALKRYVKDLPAGRTIDLKTYSLELDATLKRGYAVSKSELIQGAVAMAAPFFGADGKVAGSMAVFGPSVRLDNARVKKICAMLVVQANALSAALK